MSYDTWDWTIDTGSSYPTSFTPRWIDPLDMQPREARYQSTAPKYTDGYWVWEAEWGFIRPQCWIYMVNFFYNHRGGMPFYVVFPFELADIPEEVMIADPGGLGPWFSEVEPGAGEGPTKLMFFPQDEFPVRKIPNTRQNYWQTTGTIQFMQT